MKSKWELFAAACRQLYMSRIISISDYNSEIWYHDEKQKHFEQMFQKIQNFAVRKILDAFKTSSTKAMKVEANLLSSVIRLAQKNQIYVVQIAKMRENSSLSKICSSTFTQNFEHIELFTNNSKTAKWNEQSKNKKHSTQLIKILHSISQIKLINKHIWLKNFTKIQKSWKKSIMFIIKIAKNKELAAKTYYSEIQKLYTMWIAHESISHATFYIDKSYMNKNAIAAIVFASNKRIFNQLKIHQIHAQCEIQETIQIMNKNWNLKSKKSIVDAELFVIWKITIWSLKLIKLIKLKDEIRIYTDSQNAIDQIQKTKKLDMMLEIHRNIKILKKLNYTMII